MRLSIRGCLPEHGPSNNGTVRSVTSPQILVKRKSRRNCHGFVTEVLRHSTPA